MSNPLSKRAIWPAALALVLTPVFPLGAAGQGKLMQVGPKELIRTVSSSYDISQTGKQIGSETVTRSDYNDNTVVYESKITMKPAEGIEIVVHTELVLESESHFPLRYKMKKDIDQSGAKYTQEVEVTMYSNVAVIRSSLSGKEETTRTTLPTGAAFLDSNAAHHLYQLLFWYNKNLGGRQNFDVFDPTVKKTGTAVLFLTTKADVSIRGKETPATLYVLEREKRKPVEIYVDDEDRIVRVDQSFMLYELTDWSEQPARSKGQ